MIDAGKLDELLKRLSELMGSDEKPESKPSDKKKHRVTVMTVEMGKGVKIPKGKKKPAAEEMIGE